MKIIQVDNYDRETKSDVLVAENVPEFWAKSLVELLNEKFSGMDSPDFFKMVSDDHKLYKFEP